ncbi:MAG: cupredoxin domain-containing protein [bacterium]|nr:cupredoxin domain-containing protein [bacterium]
MNKGLMVGVIVLLIVGGVYMYSSRQAAPQENGDAMVKEEVMEAKPEGEAMMKKEEGAMMEEVDYTLDLQNFSYAPNVMEAKVGETLKVKIVNVGGFHDFVIDELGVASSQIGEGESEVVEIVIPADATGEYEFYCSVGNHRAQGMVGTLMIVE